MMIIKHKRFQLLSGSHQSLCRREASTLVRFVIVGLLRLRQHFTSEQIVPLTLIYLWCRVTINHHLYFLVIVYGHTASLFSALWARLHSIHTWPQMCVGSVVDPGMEISVRQVSLVIYERCVCCRFQCKTGEYWSGFQALIRYHVYYTRVFVYRSVSVALVELWLHFNIF